jgi:putative transposase
MDTVHIQIFCRQRPLVYHFAWGPMRSKPVLVGQVARRLEDLLRARAAELAVGVRRLEIRPALVYLAVEAPPSLAPHSIVCGLKAHSSGVLRREFRELLVIPTLWTRDYLVMAGDALASEDVLAAFLASLPPCRPRGRPCRERTE